MGFWSRKSSSPLPSPQRENVKSKHKPASKKVTSPPPPPPPPPPKPKSKPELKPKPKSKPKPRPGRIIVHFVRHAETIFAPPSPTHSLLSSATHTPNRTPIPLPPHQDPYHARSGAARIRVRAELYGDAGGGAEEEA
ncbi:hypothetical protein BELL_2389g00010 [Botrytis elliptica]|uniref:Uncharacterized protein n=1 Tax=Botrytis elliptica TaxID=278938 RepID=A0A4Z1H7R6_9HELO|nr:hypothetical protein BELL_2389g00010 [Botrytis elliptica]